MGRGRWGGRGRGRRGWGWREGVLLSFVISYLMFVWIEVRWGPEGRFDREYPIAAGAKFSKVGAGSGSYFLK